MSVCRFLAFSAIVLFATASAFAQRPLPIRPETREPPLADGSSAIQPIAAGMEPRSLPPLVPGAGALAPVVVLRVNAPSVAPVGREIEVVLIVENVSRVPALSVTVQYALPKGADSDKATPPATKKGADLVWSLETMAPGARKEIALTLKLAADATDVEHRARVQIAHEQKALTRLSKPALAVRKFGAELAQQHDILVFALEVTNVGGVELTDILVSDTLPEGFEHRLDSTASTSVAPQLTVAEPRTKTWKIDRLRSGEMRRIEYHVQARVTGAIEHSGVATSAGFTANAAPIKVTVRDLQLDLQVLAPQREVGNRPARVHVKLRNLSPRQLDNIVVTDLLQHSCKLDAISSGGQQFEGNRVQWIVQTLMPNETRVLELTVRNANGGPVGHKVTATYRGLTKTDEKVTEFDATAALQWDLRGSTPTVEVNGEVTYTLTVRNAGSGPATNVRPTVTLPEEMVFLKAQPLMHKATGPRVVFEPITLAADGTATYQIQAKAVKAAAAAKVEAELAADIYTAGPLKRQEVTAIGGAGP